MVRWKNTYVRKWNWLDTPKLLADFDPLRTTCAAYCPLGSGELFEREQVIAFPGITYHNARHDDPEIAPDMERKHRKLKLGHQRSIRTQ